MNDSQCSIFRELSQNIHFHVIVIVKGVLCTAGAVGISMQWNHFGVRFLVHEHTKILFRFFYALNIILSLIYGFFFLFEPFRCIGISIIHAAQHVLLVLSVERLFSSIFPAYFEKHSSKPFAFILALITIFGSCTYSMFELSDNFRLFFIERKVAIFSRDVPENRAGLKSLLTNVTWSNVFSLILLCFDLYLNFVRNNGTNLSLAVSYQRSENRRIVLTLLPIELTQMFFILFTNISLIIFGKNGSNRTPIDEQLFIELVTPTPFAPLILTFVIKHSIEKYKNRKHTLQLEIDHFEELRKIW
ncbi:hypothetical protein PENTCL1PPCAC_24630, partial [Pristionchus entomophagus]